MSTITILYSIFDYSIFNSIILETHYHTQIILAVSMLEIDNLCLVGIHHILQSLLPGQTAAPAWKPRCSAILIGQRCIGPINILFPVFGLLPVLIKHFEPFVHIDYFILQSLALQIGMIGDELDHFRYYEVQVIMHTNEKYRIEYSMHCIVLI